MSNPLTFLSKRAHSLLRLDPERDWLMLLISSALILTVIVVWNAWAFDTVAGGGVIGSSVPSSPPVFSRASLDTVHTIFEKRAVEESNYTSDVYHYVDPSL